MIVKAPDPRAAPIMALRHLMEVPPEPNAEANREARLLRKLEQKERGDEH